MRWQQTGWRSLLLLLLSLALPLSRAAHSHHEYVDISVMRSVAEPDACAYLKAGGNEELFTSAMLNRMARELLDARDYDQALRFLAQAFECIEESPQARMEDEHESIWLHYEYAELLRMHVLPRGPTVDVEQARQWKRDAVKHYIHVTKYADDPIGGQTVPSKTRVHVLNTIGLLMLELGDAQDSVGFFRQASAVDPEAIEPLSNAILALSSMGDVDSALNFSDRALETAPNDPRLVHNVGMSLYKLGTDRETVHQWTKALDSHRISLNKLFILATYFHEQGDGSKALFYLNQAKRVAGLVLLASPTSGSAQENHNAVRLKLVIAQLPLVYNSTTHIDQVRSALTSSLQELVLASRSGAFQLPKEYLATATAASTGYYAIHQGFYDDATIRSQLATIYRHAIPSLSYTAPHVQRLRHKRFLLEQLNEFPQPDVVIMRQRIRVGFHSSFVRHNAVRMFIQNVIGRLSHDKFEVILILDEPDTVDESDDDGLANVILYRALSKDLAEAQQQIGQLQLDILVFTEIGEHAQTYFLAFAQLALRTVLFWDHPVTSGIDTIDYFISSAMVDIETPEQEESAAEIQNLSLFQKVGEDDRYTECVYEMHHFGASFHAAPGVFPSEFNGNERLASFRSSLELPLAGTMFLVPQPLYTIHPAFDAILQRILDHVPDSFLVLPTGARTLLVDQLTARWRQSLSDSVYKRVFFVRALNHSEFAALGAMTDIVLDSFPVGGGRSNLGIFSVGTPVLVHATRTTVLQLTAAMYKAMGIDDNGWLAYSDSQYVQNAVRLARNVTLRHELRHKILMSKHKLFDNEAVVSEWETFLLNIMASAPPPSRPTGNSSSKVCPANVTHQLSSMAQLPDHRMIEYQQQVMLPVLDSSLRPKPYFLATLGFNDDPFQTAKSFCQQFEPTLDGTNHILIGKLFWNMRNRPLQPIVQQWRLDTPAHIPMQSIPIEIRRGDDLDQVARWQILNAIRRQHNHTTLMQIIFTPWAEQLIVDTSAQLKLAIPEHRETPWRLARKLMGPYITGQVEDAVQPEAQGQNCVALFMTTCKRLDLFLQTMKALAFVLNIEKPDDWKTWFCQILVVDDNSSAEDRNLMKQRFPTFEFLFKTEDQRGHTQSMQLGVASIKARYMFYLEDDWVADASLRDACVDVVAQTRSSSSCFLHEALAVLQHSDEEPLAQVLLNDKHRGWKKRISTPNDRFIDVLIHEFAVQDTAHSYAYWPGFSFNPGLWDLMALRESLKQSDPALWFDEIDYGGFEEYFSMHVWLSGLRVASLTGDKFSHSGTNGSAYVINGLPRHWDE